MLFGKKKKRPEPTPEPKREFLPVPDAVFDSWLGAIDQMPADDLWNVTYMTGPRRSGKTCVGMMANAKAASDPTARTMIVLRNRTEIYRVIRIIVDILGVFITSHDRNSIRWETGAKTSFFTFKDIAERRGDVNLSFIWADDIYTSEEYVQFLRGAARGNPDAKVLFTFHTSATDINQNGKSMAGSDPLHVRYVELDAPKLPEYSLMSL